MEWDTAKQQETSFIEREAEKKRFNWTSKKFVYVLIV